MSVKVTKTIAAQNILVVDDEATLRFLVCKILATLGYHYETAEDGRIALEKMSQTKFDLVISDMQMPNMGGMELLDYSRKHFPGVDFLIVTGFAKDVSYVDVINAGAVDFISKPFQLDELRAKIKRIFLERRYRFNMKDQVWERTQELMIANEDLQREVNDRKEAEDRLRQAKENIAAEKTKVEQASVEISSLLRSSYLDTSVRFKNENLIPCWKTTNCRENDCPAHGSDDLRCWLLVGTFCGNTVQNNISGKIRDCEKCTVYQHATAHALPAIGEQFNTLMAVLDSRVQELRREKVKAEQASMAKSEFLANMSHEIRTPLNGIVGMVELAMDSCIDERQKDFFRTINSEADSLLVIINDILDFSKIEAGKLELEKTPFDLVGIIDDIATAHALGAEKKGLELTSFVRPGTPARLIGDPGRLRQILMNIVGNALKFTSEGEIFIVAEPLEDLCDMVGIHFEVKDTGIGIPLEKQAAIFDSFTQADGSTTRKYGGTGLGTTICKRLTEMMGGEIGVKSCENGGTTFWFNIPFEKQLSLEDDLDPENLFSGVRVLLADGNASCRSVVAAYLSSWNCRVIEAASSNAALDILRESSVSSGQFDIIMLANDLPGSRACALVEGIKEVMSGEIPPVILFTSIVSTMGTLEWQEIGVRWCINKPVTQISLRNIMARALGFDNIAEDDVPEIDERDVPVNASSPANQPKILLVEDYPTNQKIARMHLRGAGWQVILAENGKQAVDLYREEGADIILMDIQMPEMDGYEATSCIRKIEGGKGRTPIIAMTAHAARTDRDRCLAAGMDDYISKPIRREALLSTVHKWLTSQRQFIDVPQTEMLAVEETLENADKNEPIDFEAALDEFMGDKELLLEVAETFVESALERIEIIEKAIAASDELIIKQEAHTLKGGAANMWANKLARKALLLEKAVEAKDFAHCQDICRSFKKEVGVLAEYMAGKAIE